MSDQTAEELPESPIPEQKGEKSVKKSWDKLSILGVFLTLLVVAFVGLQLKTEIKENDTSAQMVGVAVGKSEEEIEIKSFKVSCAGATKVCDDKFELRIDTSSLLKVRYAVAADQCASIRIGIRVDGVLKHQSDFLGWHDAPEGFQHLPLETDFIDVGPVSSGRHLIELYAEAQPSGCAADGNLNLWGGSLRVRINSE